MLSHRAVAMQRAISCNVLVCKVFLASLCALAALLHRTFSHFRAPYTMFKLRLHGIRGLAGKGVRSMMLSTWTTVQDFEQGVARVFDVPEGCRIRFYMLGEKHPALQTGHSIGDSNTLSEGTPIEATPTEATLHDSADVAGLDIPSIVHAVLAHLKQPETPFLFEKGGVGVDLVEDLPIATTRKVKHASSPSKKSKKKTVGAAGASSMEECGDSKGRSNVRMAWHVTAEEYIGKWHARWVLGTFLPCFFKLRCSFPNGCCPLW